LKTGVLVGGITLAAGAAFAQSPGQTGTSSPAAAPTLDRGLDGSQSKRFVWQMLLANKAEIQLAQMAAQRATSDDVKAFAQQMVTDHTRTNEALKPIAQQLGIQEPTKLESRDQKVADKLAKAQGADFDRQFMDAMVDSHKDVVKLTRKMAGGKARAGASGSGGSGVSGTTGTSGSAGTAPGITGITGADDLAVAQFAAELLPIVQGHLEHAQQIVQSEKKNPVAPS
jgi:predicted outer membrane protein